MNCFLLLLLVLHICFVNGLSNSQKKHHSNDFIILQRNRKYLCMERMCVNFYNSRVLSSLLEKLNTQNKNRKKKFEEKAANETLWHMKFL